MNKRHSTAVLVLPFLDGKRLKPEPRIQQQAGNVLIETRHSDLGGLMPGEGRINHPLDQIATHAAAPNAW